MDFLNHDDASRGVAWIRSQQLCCVFDCYAEMLADELIARCSIERGFASKLKVCQMARSRWMEGRST
jgi:hypothetical protein